MPALSKTFSAYSLPYNIPRGLPEHCDTNQLHLSGNATEIAGAALDDLDSRSKHPRVALGVSLAMVAVLLVCVAVLVILPD
jgi:hypothetical protein